MIKKLITRSRYESFAGSSWPSYEEFQTGNYNSNSNIQKEIDEFIKLMHDELKFLDNTEINLKTSETSSWQTKERPLTWNIVNHDLLYKRKIKNLPSSKSGIQTVCSKPFSNISIDFDGRIFLCDCPGWLPFPVGHVTEFNSAAEVFDHPTAIEIQNSILDKIYNFCDVDTCRLPKDGSTTIVRSPVRLYVGIDKSCNLTCPSCRERPLFFKEGEEVEKRKKWADHICNWITADQTKSWTIIIGADGDPFVSYVYEYLLEKLQLLNNITFEFMTNGLFLKRQLSKLAPEFLSKIKSINVSIDAATEETYKIIRRGGNWKHLIENLEYLQEISISNNIQTVGNLIIQEGNFTEAVGFVDLCKHYNMKPNLTLIEDWGTWHDFAKHAVHHSDHPRYSEFVKVFSDSKLQFFKP